MEAAALELAKSYLEGRTDDGRSGDSLPPSGADAGGNEGNSDCKTPQH